MPMSAIFANRAIAFSLSSAARRPGGRGMLAGAECQARVDLEIDALRVGRDMSACGP